MKKRVKQKKANKKKIRRVFTEAQQRSIYLDAANQIMAASAQVLRRDFDFTPEQCVEFSDLVAKQIAENSAVLEGAAVEEGK